MLFDERRLQAFVRQFPDHRVEITLDQNGATAVIKDGSGAVLASATEPSLDLIPCALAASFRGGLAEASKADPESLPVSQRTALVDGIPGVAVARKRVSAEGKERKRPTWVDEVRPSK